MDQKLILSIVTGALVLLALYRRVRRTIGRQSVRPRRMRLRISVLGIVGILFAVVAARDPNLLGGLLAGVAGGMLLGWIGLRHAKFEATAQGSFYTPHTYIGLAVSALLIARLAYRLLAIYPAMQAVSRGDQSFVCGIFAQPAHARGVRRADRRLRIVLRGRAQENRRTRVWRDRGTGLKGREAWSRPHVRRKASGGAKRAMTAVEKGRARRRARRTKKTGRAMQRDGTKKAGRAMQRDGTKNRARHAARRYQKTGRAVQRALR